MIYSECLLRLVVLRVLNCSMCLFLYGTFCYRALKLYLSTFAFLNMDNLPVLPLRSGSHQSNQNEI